MVRYLIIGLIQLFHSRHIATWHHGRPQCERTPQMRRRLLAFSAAVAVLAMIVAAQRGPLVARGTDAVQAAFVAYLGVDEPSEATADAALVFGFDIGDGPPELSPTLLHRLSLALELCRAGRVGALLLSGGVPIGKSMSEAEAMRQWLLANGIEETRCAGGLVMEPNSTSTRTNLYHSAPLLHARGWRSIYLVTSPYHEWRTLRVLRALPSYANVSALLPPHQLAQVPHHDLGLHEGVRELLAIALYAVCGWVSLS